MRPFVHLIRFAGTWALAVAGITAGMGSVGRALCLPPYWPSQYFLRCRPLNVLPTLLQTVADALITTLLLLPPAALVAAVTAVVIVGLQSSGYPQAARGLGVTVGSVSWAVVALRLEPSYLDFILGWYAVLLGAGVGAVLAWRFAGTSHNS